MNPNDSMLELEDLVEALEEFAHHALNRIYSTVKNGVIHRVKVPYVQERLELRENGYTGSFEDITKERWNGTEKRALIDTLVSSDLGKRALKATTQENGRTSDQPPIHFTQFMNKIFEIALHDKSDDVKGLVRAYAHSLLSLPIIRHATVHLHGIRTEVDIESCNGLVFRSVKPEDIERCAYIELQAFNLGPRKHEIPQVILEFDVESSSYLEAQYEVERIMIALRLFRVGQVDYSQYIIDSDSPLDMSGLHSKWTPIFTSEKYVVEASEHKSFCNFLQSINNLIPPEWITKQNEKIHDLTIAFDRYCDAILIRDPPAKRISLAVMGLEALFSEGGEGISRKLAQRLARLMLYLDMKPTVIQQIILEAYDIRSEYVHGSVPEERERKGKEPLTPEEVKRVMDVVLDLLRICILIRLANAERVDKKKLISYLEHTMIGHEKAERGLRKVCSNYSKLVGV